MRLDDETSSFHLRVQRSFEAGVSVALKSKRDADAWKNSKAACVRATTVSAHLSPEGLHPSSSPTTSKSKVRSSSSQPNMAPFNSAQQHVFKDVAHFIPDGMPSLNLTHHHVFNDITHFLSVEGILFWEFIKNIWTGFIIWLSQPRK